MTRRDSHGPIPATSTEVQELRHELDLLRDRSAQTRVACLALAAHVERTRAQSVATREGVRISRLQWHTWRAGLAAVQSRAAARSERATLHRCEGCEAVSFSSGAAEVSPVASLISDGWVVPPPPVRARLRAGWSTVVIVPALCPQCTVARDGGDAPDPGAPTGTASLDSAGVLLHVLGEISELAAVIAERSPSLDAEQALDLALDAVVGDGMHEVSSEDLAALAAALHALARELRDGSPEGDRRVVSGRSAGHFRPALRPR